MIVIEDYQNKIHRLESECDASQDKAKKFTLLNEELRDLISQERNAYNEEKFKNEELVNTMIKN